jgi:hypothetical protein
LQAVVATSQLLQDRGSVVSGVVVQYNYFEIRIILSQQGGNADFNTLLLIAGWDEHRHKGIFFGRRVLVKAPDGKEVDEACGQTKQEKEND